MGLNKLLCILMVLLLSSGVAWVNAIMDDGEISSFINRNLRGGGPAKKYNNINSKLQHQNITQTTIKNI
jgi:hypothetical protein